MSKEQQSNEKEIVTNGLPFYLMRILSMAELQKRYCEMISIEVNMVRDEKYFFNILKRKIESISTDVKHLLGKEEAKKLDEEFDLNDDITILENVQIAMAVMNNEDRLKVEEYAYSVLKKQQP